MSVGLSMLAMVLCLLLAAGILDAAPYQELQPRAGYVPVYIREGETPLSDIHPGLAEAFKEPFVGSKSDIVLESFNEPNSSNSNDQLMPEEQLADDLPEQPVEEPLILDKEASKKIIEEEAKEPNANVVEAAKEAIKELVSVFETDMLEKLGLSEDVEQAKSEDKNAEIENKPEELTIENQKKTEKDENKLLSSTKVDDKSSEKSSDVLTVEAFKAKDFNKDSIRDDEIDIPEEVTSVQ